MMEYWDKGMIELGEGEKGRLGEGEKSSGQWAVSSKGSLP